MLDDDDSSTSSSSNQSDDDNENDDDDDDDNNKIWSNHGEAQSAPTAEPVVGHHKKRIKLSLGGKFKATISSPKEEELTKEPKNESTTTTSTTKTIPMETESATKNVASVRPKPKATNPSKPAISNKSKSPITKKKVATPPSKTKENESNDTKQKPKITISKPAAATKTSTTAKCKPNDVKRRQSPKLPISSASSSATGENNTATIKKRSVASSMRSIRITPMSSPGLLLPPGKGTASEVFTRTMATAGYTTESRTTNPHRGSSVKRIVDDMFDSDVKFSVKFPQLVPEELIRDPNQGTATEASAAAAPSSSGPSKSKEEITSTSSATDETKLTEDRASILMQRLRKAFRSEPDDKQPDSIGSSQHAALKKRMNRIPQYSDMIPISLSCECPDAYIEKRLQYAKKVEEREKAIVKMQKKQETLLATPEAEAMNGTRDIPPIPIPPDIPGRDDLRTMTSNEEIFGSDDQQTKSHPLYLPKNKEFVKHLDQKCFHAIRGRYFGLNSNAIADPYFFGPNAPGLGGLTFSASTGLATASTGGGGGALGSPLFVMPAQPSSSVAASSKVAVAAATKMTTPQQATSKDITKTNNKPVAKPVA